MKSNINFRTPRVYTKDIILQYKNVEGKKEKEYPKKAPGKDEEESKEVLYITNS